MMRFVLSGVYSRCWASSGAWDLLIEKISVAAEPQGHPQRKGLCDEFPEPWREIRHKFESFERGIMKNRRSVVTAMVIAASMLTSEAMYAAPAMFHAPLYSTSGKQKLVSFNLHNGTAAPIKIKAGDTEMTLQPGTVTALKLPVGTKIVAQVATTNYEQGSTLAVVSEALSSSTVTLN
jgi:hypothetical protein